MRIFKSGNREMRTRLSIKELRFYIHTHHGYRTSTMKFHSARGAWQCLCREVEGWRKVLAALRFFGALVIKWMTRAMRVL